MIRLLPRFLRVWLLASTFAALTVFPMSLLHQGFSGFVFGMGFGVAALPLSLPWILAVGLLPAAVVTVALDKWCEVTERHPVLPSGLLAILTMGLGLAALVGLRSSTTSNTTVAVVVTAAGSAGMAGAAYVTRLGDTLTFWAFAGAVAALALPMLVLQSSLHQFSTYLLLALTYVVGGLAFGRANRSTIVGAPVT